MTELQGTSPRTHTAKWSKQSFYRMDEPFTDDVLHAQCNAMQHVNQLTQDQVAPSGL